jgi:hypothetical protein
MIVPQFRREDTPGERDPQRDIATTYQSGGRVVWVEWRASERVPVIGYKNEDILSHPAPIIESVMRSGRRIRVEWTSDNFSPLIWYADFVAGEHTADSLKNLWPHTQGTGKVADEWRIGSGDEWAQRRAD